MDSSQLQEFINLFNDRSKRNVVSNSLATSVCEKNINEDVPILTINKGAIATQVESLAKTLKHNNSSSSFAQTERRNEDIVLVSKRLQAESNQQTANVTSQAKQMEEEVVFVSETRLHPVPIRQPLINNQNYPNFLQVTNYVDLCTTDSTLDKQNNCQCTCCRYDAATTVYCEDCSFRASHIACLKEHRWKTHYKDRKFACYFCSYKAERAKNLNQHMRSRHKEKIIFQCDVCEYRTNNKLKYNGHLKSHQDKYNMKCPHCEHRTNHKGSLKIHIRKHLNEKPYECHDCGHKSVAKADLIRHIRSHTGKKLYKCMNCNFETNENRYLDSHLKIFKHTRDFNVEELRCDKCDYVAFTNRSLQWHLLVHTNEKLYECFECEYKTNSSSNFRKHEAVHAKKR